MIPNFDFCFRDGMVILVTSVFLVVVSYALYGIHQANVTIREIRAAAKEAA